MPDASPPVRRADEHEYGLTPGNLNQLNQFLTQRLYLGVRGRARRAHDISSAGHLG